jgi:hypothetical protein
MSTLVSDIVAQAFREGNYTAVGEDPTTEEMAEAVPRLRNLVSSLFGFELGEQLTDWYAPSDLLPSSPLTYPRTPSGSGENTSTPWAYPPANSRLIVSVSAATTLYFPPYPDDGARIAYIAAPGTTGIVTLSGNGRKVEGAASVVAAAAGTFDGRKWFYRADLADWVRVDQTLVEASQVPLPEEFDDLLVTGLALRLSARFGTKIDDTVAARFTDMLGRAKKRFKQSANAPVGPELQQMMREI